MKICKGKWPDKKRGWKSMKLKAWELQTRREKPAYFVPGGRMQPCCGYSGIFRRKMPGECCHAICWISEIGIRQNVGIPIFSALPGMQPHFWQKLRLLPADRRNSPPGTPINSLASRWSSEFYLT